MSYARFLRTLYRILLKRHSSILAKRANIFTINVYMVFEVALRLTIRTEALHCRAWPTVAFVLEGPLCLQPSHQLPVQGATAV